MTGLLSVLFAATFGGLVFSGDLSPYAGIGMAIFGAIVHACVIAAFSSYRGSISLHHRMNAGHQTTGLFVGLVCLLALVAGLELLGSIPRLIAAILLFFMGMDLLWTMLQREGVKRERRMRLLEPFTPKERRDETRRTDTDRVFLFDTLGHALEWSENRLLDAAKAGCRMFPVTILLFSTIDTRPARYERRTETLSGQIQPPRRTQPCPSNRLCRKKSANQAVISVRRR